MVEEKRKVLSMKNISKAYPGVTALDNVSIDFYAGEVHALLGENGAGKSTLIKIISGAHAPSSGTVIMADGKEFSSITPAVAKEYGIETIYQEFNLIGCLTVAENICFGEKSGLLVSYKHMKDVANKIFDIFDVEINPEAYVYSLPSSKQQIVEIAKAISKKCKILIMDEPSAPLSVAEVDKMFNVVRHLREQGVCIIYISHRLEELFEISDKVTVLRDGKYVTTLNTAETNRQELIKHMVGRELQEVFPVHKPHQDKIVLEAEELCGNGDSNINLVVHAGEILGLAGLVGAGRTEAVRLIYGADKLKSGTIKVKGRKVKISSPVQAIANGIGLVPEDRKRLGCLITKSIQDNITLSSLKRISKLTVINRKQDRRIAEEYRDYLKIKTPSLGQRVGNLSGGNQQKVVMAKTLAAECEIIIFDEPTRGIDVEAKQEIYKLMAQLADEGKAIIMISSEMEELIGMSDRIAVFYEGRITGELQKNEFTQERILQMASGLEE